MAKPLSILYVSSEVFPFAKVGGIGDIAYSLPLAVRDIGHDIRVMLPKYGVISERRNKIHEINRLRDMPIPIGNNFELATVKSSSICNPRCKVQAYIATNQKYFDSKKGIYGDPKNGKDYVDNDERFLFFSRSVIETCLLLGWFPDIIHCNDWQTALVPAFIKIMFPNKFKKTKILLTVHNFSQQGIFNQDTYKKTGFADDIKENFMHNDNVNYLKAGLVYADFVNTVSKTYAEEVLQDTQHTNGLNSLLLSNPSKFTGIMNGIDVWGWNPKNDSHIKKNLTDDFEDFKSTSKKTLLESLGLNYNSETPVIGMIAKFTESKGIDLLIEAMPQILGKNVQLIILGDGETKFKNDLKKLSKQFSGKFALKIGFDEDLAHLLEAGSDYYLIPSKYEPCGLNTMYSIKYGTMPIVRATGGLNEIVKQYDKDTKEGNGLIFRDYKPEALLEIIDDAIKLYSDKDNFLNITKAMMQEDFSWNESVKQYISIYNNILKD
jgi:starch synthase